MGACCTPLTQYCQQMLVFTFHNMRHSRHRNGGVARVGLVGGQHNACVQSTCDTYISRRGAFQGALGHWSIPLWLVHRGPLAMQGIYSTSTVPTL